MLNMLLFVAIGIFIGWNFTQPAYAKLFQDWVLSKWKEFRNK